MMYLALIPAGTYAGSGVYNALSGTPIGGVLVKLVDYPKYNTTTDVNGIYSMPNVPIDTYSISASKQGYVTNTSSVTVKEASTVVKNFTLFNLTNYPYPFVSSGREDVDVVIPSSDVHGYYGGSAHTQDTTGATEVVNSLLSYPPVINNYTGVLDTDISTYSGGIVTVDPNARNIITLGGFYVNQLEYKYNNDLSVRFKSHPSNGTLGIYVTNTDHYYFNKAGAFGKDYGFISLHNNNSRWLLFVAGMTKDSTKAASEVLGKYKDYPLDGNGAVLMYADTDGNSILDTISIEEIVPDANLINLSVYPSPFVSGGREDVDVVIPSSDVHGYYGGSSHTQDTTGAIEVVNSLFTYPLVGNNFTSVLDTDISNYGSGIVTVNPNARNIITFGGFYVNQLEYKYNDNLSIRFKSHPSNGTLGVYVANTDHYYFNTAGAYGKDYGFITLYDDSRTLLFVVGMTKDSTKAASKVLSKYQDYLLTGTSAVVMYADTNGDSKLDTITIVETV